MARYLPHAEILFTIMKNKLIIILLLFAAYTHGNSCMSGERAVKYTSEEFGYILLDESSLSAGLFKYDTDRCGSAINIANCTVKESNGMITIDNYRSEIQDATNMILNTSHQDYVDSLTVRFKIPRTSRPNCYITVISNDTTMSRQFNKEGVAEFRMKKHKFIYDNFISVLIHPNVDPFKRHTSWGDNETLSHVELDFLRYEKVLYDSSLSFLDAFLPGFSDNLFQRWIIADDVVLKTGGGIIWRGMLFVKDD